MPQRTAIYLLVMLVPVLALLLLNAMQIVPTVELKAALATFTAAGGAALGHGFAKDAIAIAKAKKRSRSKLAAAEESMQAAVVRVLPVSASESQAETKRALRDNFTAEESR